MMRMWALIQKELLVLRKDWHGLLVLFIMPALFILIMSLAMRDTFSERHQVNVDLLLYDGDRSAFSEELAYQLARIEGFALQSATEQSEVEARLARDEVKFALIIEPGFALGLQQDKLASPGVQLLFSPTASGQLQTLLRMAVEDVVRGIRLELALESLSLRADGVPSAQSLREVGRLDHRFVYQGDAPEALPTSVQQSVPAWLVFAMFFVVIPLSTAFIIERQQGSLLRLRIMNISGLALISGKIIPYYLVNQVQMVLMVLVGIHLVPLLGGDSLQMGGSLIGLFLISSATSLAAIAWALLITTIARTHVQATTLGGIANIIFAALGGIMVPKFVMPPFMRELADVSPMSWGLEGFLDIFLRQAGWQAVLPEAAALLGFALVSLALASLIFSRRE